MKKKYFLTIAVIIVLIFICGCEAPSTERFDNMGTCKSKCIDKKYEEGRCYTLEETKKSYWEGLGLEFPYSKIKATGECTIVGIEKCREPDACKCYCYNLKNPPEEAPKE